jgi:hypothetical protein
MANYLDIQKEETLKAMVFYDYFDEAKFACEPDIGNIDFIATNAKLVAGTGNLLVGLASKYNIWDSTIDQSDVDTMKALIDEGFNLLPAHVFLFDFLNDKFDKLPPELKK